MKTAFSRPKAELSDVDLVCSIERARRRNRSKETRQGWERDLWDAYILEGPGRPAKAANEYPPDSA